MMPHLSLRPAAVEPATSSPNSPLNSPAGKTGGAAGSLSGVISEEFVVRTEIKQFETSVQPVWTPPVREVTSRG